MRRLNFKEGFTLIELLVVVAIIGILASVVLASLNTARNKGADAAIKADLSGVRSSAENFYDSNNTKYNDDGTTAATGTDCGTNFTAHTMFADSNISAALAHAESLSGSVPLFCNLAADGSAYAIAVSLKSTGKYWCIDSTGVGKGIQGSSTNDYTALNGVGTAALTDNTDMTCN